MSAELIYIFAGIGIAVVAGAALLGGLYLAIQIAAWRGMN